MMNNSYYGGYRTSTFVEIWNNVDAFIDDYTSCGIPETIDDETNAKTLFYLLYAKYGNSHIRSSDPNQFKYRLFTTIFEYGPAWERRLAAQNEIRQLSLSDLQHGSKAIVNHALNPDTAPSTSSLTELTAIDSQSTTTYVRGATEAYSALDMILETDVTEQFLRKFEPLFITIMAPDYPLLYSEV